MDTKELSLDRISTLPDHIFQNILTRMPIKDALRTSILQKNWRYSWRAMPKLVFTDDMVKVSSPCYQLKKYKLFTAIFHVLLLHNGPTKLEFNFDCSVARLGMNFEFDHIYFYLSRENNVKELSFFTSEKNYFYRLPDSFFSLQGLERISLERVCFIPPLRFSGFSCVTSMILKSVEVIIHRLPKLFYRCPLLEHISLIGFVVDAEHMAPGNIFTFDDLLITVPLIKTLEVSKAYMKYLCAGGMPYKLPKSLAHLKSLSLEVCLLKHNQISSALCLIRSSPLLVNISFWMYEAVFKDEDGDEEDEDEDDDEDGNDDFDDDYSDDAEEDEDDYNVDREEEEEDDDYDDDHDEEEAEEEKFRINQQTSNNFFDVENNSDLKLDHLETLKMRRFSNLRLEREFVKLIMAKSPALKKVRIQLSDNVSALELKMVKELVLHSFLRASPFVKLIIERPKKSS